MQQHTILGHEFFQIGCSHHSYRFCFCAGCVMLQPTVLGHGFPKLAVHTTGIDSVSVQVV